MRELNKLLNSRKKLIMIKQSNINFHSELSTKTRNQSMEKNYICQRFAAR